MPRTPKTSRSARHDPACNGESLRDQCWCHVLKPWRPCRKFPEKQVTASQSAEIPRPAPSLRYQPASNIYASKMRRLLLLSSIADGFAPLESQRGLPATRRQNAVLAGAPWRCATGSLSSRTSALTVGRRIDHARRFRGDERLARIFIGQAVHHAG